MNRKKRIKSIIFGFLAAALLCTTVFAAPVWKNASIAYNNLKVNIDGVETVLTNLEGEKIEPFIYDGVAYVPLSPLARALGRNAAYDPETITIFITTPVIPPPPAPKVTYLGVDLLAYEKNYYIYEDKTFKMLGDEYKGLTFYRYGNNQRTEYVLYNLRGQYKTIKGTLGHIDESNRNVTGTLNIYLDNELSKSYSVAATMLPLEVNINVTGVNVIKIEMVFEAGAYSDGYIYGFGNVIIE